MFYTAKLYITNHVTNLLPPTRFYKLKSFLYRMSGVRSDPTCRIVSSVNIWGIMRVEIGKDTFIGHEVLIVGGESTVSIGANVDIAPRVTIVTGSHNTDMLGERSAGEGYSKNITIEDGVWIGAGTMILGGIIIGRKAIIGAGSVVSRSIPPAVIAVGNPCRPIKQWDPVVGWEKINS